MSVTEPIVVFPRFVFEHVGAVAVAPVAIAVTLVLYGFLNSGFKTAFAAVIASEPEKVVLSDWKALSRSAEHDARCA